MPVGPGSVPLFFIIFFFFNDTATTEIYTLSLHDALPLWIVRTTDPVTKRPVPQPAEFYIDATICMSCGLCAEFCPFDAIKMDHDFEIATYDRTSAHVYDKAKLSKPVSYYASIRPTNY